MQHPPYSSVNPARSHDAPRSAPQAEDASSPAGLRLGPVRSFEEACAAFRLVCEEYLKSGYQEPNTPGMRYSVLQLLPYSQTYIAASPDGVVGTGTVVLDSPAGLPSSDVFGDIFEQRSTTGLECRLLRV